MTYEMYRSVFLYAAIACGVLLVISAALFIALRIPKVISDLTGRSAKKAIKNIRMQNEQSGDKTYQSSAVNLRRGKITDKITESGRIIPRDETPFGTGSITEKISTQQLSAEGSAGETSVLTGADEALPPDSGAGETAVLDAAVLDTAEQPTAQEFAIEFEITFIHTNEVIA